MHALRGICLPLFTTLHHAHAGTDMHKRLAIAGLQIVRGAAKTTSRVLLKSTCRNKCLIRKPHFSHSRAGLRQAQEAGGPGRRCYYHCYYHY